MAELAGKSIVLADTRGEGLSGQDLNATASPRRQGPGQRAGKPGHADGGLENRLSSMKELLGECTSQEERCIWRILSGEIKRLGDLVPFDFVVGNPAWINWEDLPADFRGNVSNRVREYGLMSPGRTVGAIKIDLSGLSLLMAADRLLGEGGVLGYVLTQAALKAKSMSGLRRFTLPDGTPLRPLVAHDFSSVQLFSGATNRTASLVVRKGLSPVYPVPTIHWSNRILGTGRVDGATRRVPSPRTAMSER